MHSAYINKSIKMLIPIRYTCTVVHLHWFLWRFALFSWTLIYCIWGDEKLEWESVSVAGRPPQCALAPIMNLYLIILNSWRSTLLLLYLQHAYPYTDISLSALWHLGHLTVCLSTLIKSQYTNFWLKLLISTWKW